MDNLNLEQVLALITDKWLPRGVAGGKVIRIKSNHLWDPMGEGKRSFKWTIGSPLGEQKDAEKIFTIIKQQKNEET